MAKPEQTFWKQVTEEVGKDLKSLKDEYTEAARGLEQRAARALIAAGKTYEKYDMNERTWAAAIGAKAGATIGIIGGLPGMKVGAAVGGGLGLAFGKKGADKLQGWMDKHDPDKQASEAGNDNARGEVKKDAGPGAVP